MASSGRSPRGFVDAYPDAILLADPDTGLIEEVNEAATELFDRPRDELLGTPQMELHPVDEEHDYGDLFESHTRQFPSVIREFEDGSPVYIETGDGRRVPVEINGWMVESRGRRLFQGVFRDVSERLEYERKLAIEREKYAAVVENSGDGIVIVQDGAVVFANGQTSALTGYDERALLDTDFSDLVAGAGREVVDKLARQGSEQRRVSPPAGYTFDLVTKRGYRRTIEANVSTITFGDEPALLATLRDVTEQQEYQRELRSLNRELEALNRLVRHDIRNEMSIVIGWAQIVADHTTDEGKDALRKVFDASKHVVELTKTTRDYMEVLTEGGEVETAPTRLDTLLREEVEFVRTAYPDSTVRFDGEVPSVRVLANGLLPSAFRNLLNNGVQHNDRDHPVVTVTATEETDSVVVEIADDGPGVPDEVKEEVFGKGDRGLESEGTGIGLYLVDTIVTRSGGEVWVEDNDPRGAVFVVRLPRPSA